jgi:hypothetical protein
MEFELEPDDAGDTVLTQSPLDYLPRVPSLGVVWSF